MGVALRASPLRHKKSAPKPNINFWDLGENMFPSALSQTFVTNFGIYVRFRHQQILWGQKTCPHHALGKNLAQNWCPTDMNRDDFKHSIKRPSARPCEQDGSRIARLFIPPCSHAALACSDSAHLAWLPLSMLSPSVLSPWARPKWRRRASPLALGMDSPVSAEVQSGRRKGLDCSDNETSRYAVQKLGVSQKKVLGAGMR
jgi:hypothetical protein